MAERRAKKSPEDNADYRVTRSPPDEQKNATEPTTAVTVTFFFRYEEDAVSFNSHTDIIRYLTWGSELGNLNHHLH